MKTKITERMLLDNYYGLSYGMDMISIVHGEKIYWNYRKENYDEPDTYCVCFREDADVIIVLDYDSTGISVNLDADNNNHVNYQKIEEEYESIVADYLDFACVGL